MWIRSQDKRMLLDCKGFRYFDGSSEPVIWGCIDTAELHIGRYPNEHEANAVLDMLMERAADPWERDEYGNGVFVMPPKGFLEGDE